MRKEIYILNGLSSEDYISFKKRILKISQSVLEKHGPESLKIVLTV